MYAYKHVRPEKAVVLSVSTKNGECHRLHLTLSVISTDQRFAVVATGAVSGGRCFHFSPCHGSLLWSSTTVDRLQRTDKAEVNPTVGCSRPGRSNSAKFVQLRHFKTRFKMLHLLLSGVLIRSPLAQHAETVFAFQRSDREAVPHRSKHIQSNWDAGTPLCFGRSSLRLERLELVF